MDKVQHLPYDRHQKRIILALTGLMLSGTLINLSNVCSLHFFRTTYTVFETIIDIAGVLMFVVGLTEILRKNAIFVISSTLLFAIIWILSGFIYPVNSIYLQESFQQFFIYVLPFMWIGRYLIKEGMYLDQFLLIARIKLILVIATQIIIFIDPFADIFAGDYMDASNAMIVGIVSVYFLAARDKKILDMLLSVIATIMILVSGSRGALVSLAFFWIIYLFTGPSKGKGWLYITLILIGSIMVLDSEIILMPIKKIAENLGFSTHLIDALTSKSIFEDSNRSSLFSSFWQCIWQRPLGYGVMGDRAISIQYGIWNKPIYPHNIYLEILINFGYIVGSIICILLTLKLVSLLYLRRNSKIRDTVLILTSAGFIRLLVSSSYWNEQIFFMLLGVISTTVFRNIKFRFGRIM